MTRFCSAREGGAGTRRARTHLQLPNELVRLRERALGGREQQRRRLDELDGQRRRVDEERGRAALVAERGRDLLLPFAPRDDDVAAEEAHAGRRGEPRERPG